MIKKDMTISFVAHLVLIALIAIINPISAMFREKPEIIIVKTFEESGGPASKRTDQEEPAAISPPKAGKPVPEKVDDAVPIKPVEKAKPVAEKPKPKPKKKPKPEPEKQEIESSNEPEGSTEEKSEIETPKPDGKGGIDVSEKLGGGGTGVGKGTGDLPYNIGMVLSVIERNWRNVVSDANPITCTVYFQIDRYGYVVGDPIIEKSSGLTTFDQGCILAIRRAGQFPAFPANFNYQYIGLHLDFQYVPGM